MIKRKAGRCTKRFSKVLVAMLCAVILFVDFSVPVQAQKEKATPHVVTVYNEQNGLPTGEANTILQTSDGHIWIGSYGGLIRYNGTDFRNYSVEGAITSSSIRSLFEDSQGRLWIGTNDAGVVMMEKDVFTEIVSPEDKSFLCIRDFEEGADGTIYVASNSGLAKIMDGKVQPYDIEEIAGNTIYSIAIDSHGRVWGAMNNGDCVVLQNDALIDIFESGRVLDGTDIYSVDADEAGNIILGTSSNTVVVLKFPTESLKAGAFDADFHSTGNVSVHNSVSASNGYILVSAINGVAVITPDGIVTEFGEEDKAMSVNAAVADYENNLWLASSSYGVIRYSQGCFESPNAVAKLSEVAVNAVAYQGGYWYIGTDTGLIVCDEDWNRVTNELTDMFQDVRIRCIIADGADNIWLASYSDNAVVSYNAKKNDIGVYNTENGLVGDRARVLMALSDGSIAVGTQTGVSIIKDGVVTESYDHDDGIDNPTILCLAEGNDGELLAGSDGNGIYTIKDGRITNHGFTEGLEEGVVLRMLQDADKTGWFISAGSSLYYWKDGQFSRLTNFTKDAGSIFDLYDKDGKLWIIQNSGVIAMDKATLLSKEATDTIHYSFNHGLTGSINANTWNYLDESGILYLTTRNGISEFAFQGVSNAAPKLCISRVIVDGQVYEHPTELKLDSSAQRITIDFAALSYTDTIELRVTTTLKGFDKTVELAQDKSGTVSYTNLPGGNYVFEVTVYSPENPEIMETCTLAISKEKQLVELATFWIAMAVLLIVASCGIVMLVAKVKLNRLHRRQQEYRDIIEQALSTFAKMIDAKDAYTNGHSIRVAEYSRELAKRMNMSAEAQENIYYMALLHDIGKIGVPDHILNKPGKLTAEEMNIIRQHVNIGGEILKNFTALEGIADGAKYHHERYDGTGYSEGLAGLDIPQVARIIGVADSYDAMSSDRCYRNALTPEKIEEELLIHCGKQFDPEVVPHMMAMIEEGKVPVQVGK